MWTPATALPEQSARPLKLSSHSMALGVEQAMEGPPGTVRTAEICAFTPKGEREGGKETD